MSIILVPSFEAVELYVSGWLSLISVEPDLGGWRIITAETALRELQISHIYNKRLKSSLLQNDNP